MNTVFYLKLSFLHEIDTKTCTFKNLVKIWQKYFATLDTLMHQTELP